VANIANDYRIDNYYNYQCNDYVDANNYDIFNSFNYYYWCDKLVRPPVYGSNGRSYKMLVMFFFFNA